LLSRKYCKYLKREYNNYILCSNKKRDGVIFYDPNIIRKKLKEKLFINGEQIISAHQSKKNLLIFS